ncbi:MAG: extracellular solute-binding protein [Chloroflexota bacterium]|nr:extracellular solute-binding protein [Chloroflexota bacterium]
MAEGLTRRGILKLTAGSAGAALLAACGGGTAATNTPAGPKATALQGGTGGQTAVPAVTSAPAAAPTTVSGSAAAAVATKPAAASAASGTTTAAISSSLPTNVPNTTVKGNVRYWQTTYDPPGVLDQTYHDQWITNLKTVLPGVTFNEEQYAYGDMLDKLRVVLKANQGPDAAVIVIQWCPELAASGVLSEINLADFGYTADKFWPGALKSVTWNGKLYGIPTNNETMAMIYNKDIFQKAGLDPNKGPETWEDVKNFSKQIKDKTGKAGYGMVAKLNNGNIPYRYMPLTWAYGGGALDEASDNPTYQKSMFDSDGNIQALQWMLDVFSYGAAPQSTLTNTQTEIRDLFTSGEVAIMIDHPVAYQVAKVKAPDVAEQMAYVLMPKGPVRRAVAFGGSNYVVFKAAKDQDAAKAVGKDRTSPYWSTRLIWTSSNPGNRDAFASPEQAQRLNDIKFLNITTEMLQYGISFPAIPENSDIVNLIVPQMIQEVLTKAKTPQQAGQDAAKKVNDMIAKRK